MRAFSRTSTFSGGRVAPRHTVSPLFGPMILKLRPGKRIFIRTSVQSCLHVYIFCRPREMSMNFFSHKYFLMWYPHIAHTSHIGESRRTVRACVTDRAPHCAVMVRTLVTSPDSTFLYANTIPFRTFLTPILTTSPSTFIAAMANNLLIIGFFLQFRICLEFLSICEIFLFRQTQSQESSLPGHVYAMGGGGF